MAALVQRIRARAASLPTFDIPFLLILLLLLSYGLIMLFSAGYAVALYRRGDAYTYIRPQLLFAALGVLAMYAASLVDYHVWPRLGRPVLGVSPPCRTAEAGLADAGDLAAFACHRAFHAGVQRLQAVDRAAGAGHAAAQ